MLAATYLYAHRATGSLESPGRRLRDGSGAADMAMPSTRRLLIRQTVNANPSGTSTPVAVAVALATTAGVVVILALVIWHMRFSPRARLRAEAKNRAKNGDDVHTGPEFPASLSSSTSSPPPPPPLVSPTASHPGLDGVLLTPPPRLQHRKLLPPRGANPSSDVKDPDCHDAAPPDSARSSDATATEMTAPSSPRGRDEKERRMAASDGITRKHQYRPFPAVSRLAKYPGPPPSRALPPPPPGAPLRTASPVTAAAPEKPKAAAPSSSPPPPPPPRPSPDQRDTPTGCIRGHLMEKGELERLAGTYR
ncbi:hypothetical protein XA68_11591 [Ophiocordyceps unilateralis]|uniref:Uncharacterized protein n=1 Tax=Ophiocordyceps unilateralis TaxID=268505 RepID=A0A2A9NWZ8_OPHUN|nr:hypothetical protein XA68_11591 [Ophiocordyceps unilateralis]